MCNKFLTSKANVVAMLLNTNWNISMSTDARGQKKFFCSLRAVFI